MCTELVMDNDACKYTTGVSELEELGCFLQQIKLPHGRTLDIATLNTASLQVGICLSNPTFKFILYSLQV